eukprot:3784187-Amphidinium_carterae.1
MYACPHCRCAPRRMNGWVRCGSHAANLLHTGRHINAIDLASSPASILLMLPARSQVASWRSRHR